ncbi:MAG: YihY family inner membrane protein [bacterium]
MTPSETARSSFESPSLQSWAGRIGALAARSGRKFLEDGCFLWATALAYTTLLALVPITVLSFSIFSAFSTSAAVLEQVREMLFAHFIPSSGDVIYRYLRTFSENAGALSFYGLLFLIFMAYSLIQTLERAFVRVWGIARSRSAFQRFATFWAVITLVPFLIAGSLYLSSWFRVVAEVPGVRWVERVGVPILMTWAAFFCLYRFVPRTGVTWRGALAGAIVGGTLWETAKWGFDAYVKHFTSLNQLYGSLGVIPIFLIWLYLTWFFVLYGAEVALLVQSPALGQKSRGADFQAYRSYYTLRAMLQIGRAFRKGEPPVPSMELAKRLDLDRVLVSSVLDRLVEVGVLIPSDSRERSYLLARSPESIRAGEVVEAAVGDALHSPGAPGDPTDRYVRGLLDRVRGAHQSAWGDMTLETLLRESEDFMIAASLDASEIESPDKRK